MVLRLCAKVNHVILLGPDTSKGLDAVNTLNCSYGKDKATFMRFDVNDKAVINEVLKKIKSKFKKVEIFVHCAGIWDEKNWELQTRTNFEGTVRVTSALLNIFEKSNGIIINFSGVMGLHPFPYSPVFAADCIAIIRYCQSVGHDINYRRSGMRIVVLCTGVTTCTDFTKDVAKRMTSQEMSKGLTEYLDSAHRQKPDACAKSVIELIKYADPGTVWLIERSQLERELCSGIAIYLTRLDSKKSFLCNYIFCFLL